MKKSVCELKLEIETSKELKLKIFKMTKKISVSFCKKVTNKIFNRFLSVEKKLNLGWKYFQATEANKKTYVLMRGL